MQAAISAARERFTDNCLHPLGAKRKRHDFAAVLLFQLQRRFQCISVRLVDLVSQITVLDPGLLFIDTEDRIVFRYLFKADDDIHYCFLSVVSGQWSVATMDN